MVKPLSQAITFRHMVQGLTRILEDQLVKHFKGRVEVLVPLNFVISASDRVVILRKSVGSMEEPLVYRLVLPDRKALGV